MLCLETKSWAKINLYLLVKGKRADGFHDLDTLFQEIDLADRLVWSPDSGSLEIDVLGAVNIPLQENLCFKVAQKFTAVTGINVNGRLIIHKHIPMGGGLGGGSANAVAFLKLLISHFQPIVDEQEWLSRLLEIGSDLPFFWRGGSQRAQGRGEVLAIAPHNDLAGFLFLAPFGLPTASVFKALIPDDYKGDTNPQLGKNHLVKAAIRVNADFGYFFNKMKLMCGDHFFMTGSGSTCVLVLKESLPAEVIDFCADQQVRVLPFKSKEPGV